MVLLSGYRMFLIVVAGLIVCASAGYTKTVFPEKDTIARAAPASDTGEKVQGQARLFDAAFLTQYRFICDLNSYALHKNAFFERQYLAGSLVTIEADIVEIFNALTFFSYTTIDFGLGKVPGNIVFTFLNTNPNMAIAARYRFDRFIAAFAMNHFCYHDITSELFPVIYCNTFNLSASSIDFRKSDYWPKAPEMRTWKPQAHPWWNVDLCIYLRRLGGLVGEEKLNGFNDRLFDVKTSALLPLYNTRNRGVGVTGDGIFGIARENNGYDDAYGYWSVALGAELHLRGRESFVLYCKYTLDDMPEVTGLPRFSKDQLLQIGIRFLK